MTNTLAQIMAEKDCLTVREAAAELRTTNKIVRKLIKTGRLQAEYREILWIPRKNLEDVRVRKVGRPPAIELTPEDIAEIARRRCSGEIMRTIANDFGITCSLVSQIGLRHHRLKGRQIPSGTPGQTGEEQGIANG